MHESKSGSGVERLNVREQAWPLYVGSQIIGLLGLVAAVVLGYFANDEFKGFFHSYLVAYMFFLAIALGGLVFVLLQHVTKAGWSVNVRRIAEWYGATLPLMAVLSAPIVATVVMGRHGHSQLYPWDTPSWNAASRGFKGAYLSPDFFLARMVIYFACWSAMGVWYWKQSVKQDETGDINLTKRMQYWAPIGLIVYGLTVTFALWDWVMSLDPMWYSTIFGVYYFAGSAIAIFATIILTVRFLQKRGLLQKSVTVEHYHDLGKLLFAFVFFWGYIGFAQYMLQWYGNIPDETEWWLRHGASSPRPNQFTPVVTVLLFGHVLIPFAGLLSRHVKRNLSSLSFWAVWMLVFCWVDMYWLIMPQLDNGMFHIGLIDLAAFVGIGGVFVAFVVRKAGHDSVRAMRDPRLPDSLAFENF